MTIPVDAFVQTAAEFCSLIENHEQHPVSEFLQRARKILPLLYHRALMLPKGEGSDHKLDRDISHDQWTEMFTRLREYIGEHDLYWEIFDPVKKEHDDPVASSLSDDLADVWRGLKNGLLHWTDASDTLRKEIVWQWRFDFSVHWSSHVVDALRTINSLIEVHDAGGGDNDA